MGFGTQQQLGNRTGITNQTSLPDFFGGGGGISPQPGGGNITPIGLGQQLDGGQFGGQQNQLFTLLQQLLGGQGGFQQAPGQQIPGGPLPPVGAVKQPPIGFAPPPGKDFGGNITPIGLGQPSQSLDVMPRGFGNTPLTQLSNPFGNLINQSFFR